jgi:virginiamycin B lyase
MQLVRWTRAVLFAALAVTVTLSAQVTEFPLPTFSDSVPYAVTTGPDGAVWYTRSPGGGFGYGPHRIGRITMAGVIAEFDPPTGQSYPLDIAAGSDGALWFTEAKQGKIGRVTTSGAITEFALPTIDTFPRGITAGPDGALWFTEGSKIGRISTTGVITELALPPTISAAGRITTGPDGALWFIAFQVNNIDRIVRITTAGAVTEFTVPRSRSAVSDIVAGPDGALWFTEGGTNAIGRITTAGVLTEFALPTDSSSPHDIVVGPDGALWFTEFSGNKIGRITTGGVVTEVAIPRPSNPAGLTIGSDGALWFAAFGGIHSIDRLAITADLAIAQTVDPPAVRQATTTTFRVTVTNEGAGQATAVTVANTLPSGLTLVSAIPSQGSCGGTTTVTCSLGTLAPAATVTIAIMARATGNPGTLNNTVTVSASETDPHPANNTSTIPVTIVYDAAIPAVTPLGLFALLAALALVSVTRLGPR